MKLKFKPEELPKRVDVLKRLQLSVLLLLVCLYVLPINSFATDGNPSRKINLKVGDVLNYQLNEFYFYDHDTVKSSSWFNFKVVDKKDTLYSMVCIPNRKIKSTKNGYSDTRFRETPKDFLSLEDYQNIPFYLSESGIIQPFAIPDSITKRLIKEKYPNDLHGASLLIKNLENYQEVFIYIFQQFFIDWHLTKEGQTTTKLKLNDLITNSTIQDISPLKDLSELVLEFETSPANALFEPALSYSKGNSKVKISRSSGTISEMNSRVTFTRHKTKDPKLIEADTPQEYSSQILKFIPGNDSTVTITGTLDKSCNPETLNCYIITNYIGRGDKFTIDKDIVPGTNFKFNIPLNSPVATNLSIGIFDTYSSFLLEPGDSIHLTITPNGVEFSGKDALKSKLCMAMRESRLNVETSLTEAQQKQKVENWISNEQQKIESFKDQISWWAYNQIRCDIYYSGMNNLISYYYTKNGQKVNPASFEALFDTIQWDDYQSFSSMDMMLFIGSYLDRKLLIMKGVKENSITSETDKYNLAKIIFKNKIRYYALSQCVYEALKKNNIEEGRTLFRDYEKIYQGTGFYPFLKKKLENRVDLSNGATAPEFIATDIKGTKILLEKLKGKYVQLLFIDLEREDQRIELEAYQKLKELPSDKFELITVFVNKIDSLTDAYIKKNQPKGILVSNPDWQLEQLKKFRSEYTSPYYLVNPKGIIVFSGSGSPTEYFVQMIIEMINNDNYNDAEASVSKSTLYWVLSLSLLAIILTLVVVWFVTKAIKKRETVRREQLELKLSAVRSQLNPHFLFNAMTSIQYLVNHDEKEKANLFLSKFAQLMRKVLLQSETERVPLSDELATIETYLELEALRHRFNYRIQVDEGIDQHNTEIPVMLLQPFVENAVIHGIAHLGEKGNIAIKVEKWENNQLKIKIVDNGLGYSDEVSVHSGSNGKGMQITRKRVDLMMAKYGHEIDFKVNNRKELDVSLSGTEVVITFETEK